MSVLEARNLSLTYGNGPIIDRLTLAVPKEQITVFIGSNGCGKSTLLRSMARLLKPSEGEIVLEGKLIAELPTKEIARKR